MPASPRLTGRLTAAGVLAAALCTTAVLSASPAHAATTHPSGHRAAHTSAAPKPRKPAHHAFVARGLVVSHDAASVTVLAHTVRSGRTTSHDVALTVAVPRRGHEGRRMKGALRHVATGDAVTISGTATIDGNGTASFTAHGVADHAAPFHAYLGIVTAVDGSTAQVTGLNDSGEDDNAVGDFTVDVSTATTSVDGASGSLQPGQFVAFLGSRSASTVVASSVWAFSTVPDVVGGRVTAVNGTVVTLADGHDAGTDVDLASTPLILDGTSNSTPDQLPVGAVVLVLGSADANGTFTPDIALAFAHNCSSRSHGDGGQDSD